MVARADGQSTVEWVGLLALMALLVSALGALAGVALPGTLLARAITGRIVCALDLSSCDAQLESALVAAYGDELAGLVSRLVPQIRYEPGMHALPVDFRGCRRDACAEGRDGVRVARSLTGQPAAAFTHVIDCRSVSQTAGADCSGDAAGNLYVQYWLYYPGSATGEGSTFLRGAIRGVSAAIGHPSYHPDDWESVQLRVGSGARAIRASSHHGYGVGWVPAATAAYTVSGGSHAGSVRPAEFARLTTPRRLELIPLETLVAEGDDAAFAITPPWRKRAWSEPEYEGTD